MQKNKTALMKAADILARQEQSSKVLKRKLLAKKYSEEESQAAIETLIERNYLNDEETCRRQFENFYSERKMSVRQICAKLIQRGFDSAFVKNLIPADRDEYDFSVANRILEKNFSRVNFSELDAQEKFKIKNKIYRQLSAKGFSSETISAVMENFFTEENF